jgi:hypothetical protein
MPYQPMMEKPSGGSVERESGKIKNITIELLPLDVIIINISSFLKLLYSHTSFFFTKAVYDLQKSSF